MKVDPERVEASGQLEASVTIRVFKIIDEIPKPIRGAEVEIFSSRNHEDTIIDIIQQPTEKTDSNGQTVAMIGSNRIGEAIFTATLDGDLLCEGRQDGRCIPLQKTIIFISHCPNPEHSFCDGECVDLITDSDNCGDCGITCNFNHASAACENGVCIITGCELDWADCNSDPDDGCEADLMHDPNNCGACRNACSSDVGCAEGVCMEVNCDRDNDGCIDVTCGGIDCADDDPSICGAPPEICDGEDNNCNDIIDEDPEASESCDDYNQCTDDLCIAGQGCVNICRVEGTPCDDEDENTTNDRCEFCLCIGDEINCDYDHDGYIAVECGGDDCDDTDPFVNPGMNEGPPASPSCYDGKDNDCDGLTDINDYLDCSCCEDEYCQDNNWCNGYERCINCVCVPGIPVNCDDGNICTDDVCDPPTGNCNYQNNTQACEDGDLCTIGDVCIDGSCHSGAQSLCDDSSVCTDDTCNPSTGGCIYAPNNSSCDDRDECTTQDTCANGACRSVPLDADGDGHVPSLNCGGDDCDDNDPDVHAAVFEGGRQDDPICTDGVDNDCDGETDADDQQCVPCVDDSDCDDDNVCNGQESCQAGACTATEPVICTAQDSCHDPGVCIPATGACTNPAKPDGVGCELVDLCRLFTACQNGTCIGRRLVECPPTDQCHTAGSCNPNTGACSNPNKPDGSPCDDGDACTLADTCQAGTCIGASPVACAALDQCHDVGTCDPESGVCTQPNKPDDTPCDDGNACTTADSCHLGICAGGDPIVCAPLDQCHDAGVCNSRTGACSNPWKPDGTACDDGDACSSRDACIGGVCTSGPTDKDNDGDTFLDGTCPGGNDCNDDVASIHPGGVEGPTGDATCADNIDNDCDMATDLADTDCKTCSADGECDDDNPCMTDACSAGACRHTPVSDGTACDDGDMCTQTDTCHQGICTGQNLVVCASPDQCHLTGTCDPATGICSNPEKPDGFPCDDNDACTQTDECINGICAGSDQVVCEPSDQCHQAGICIPVTGLCSDPLQNDDHPCDDGNACTQTDSCQAGACAGTDPVVCMPQDQCHEIGYCNPATGVCTNPAMEDGTPCDDADGCTQTDTCQSGYCLGNHPVVCMPTDQCHHQGACDPLSGICTNPEKVNGMPCDDGDACTSEDICIDGICTGSPYDCNDGDLCTVDECNGDGTCSHPFNPDEAHPDYDCIESACDNIDNDCDGCTDEGCPGYLAAVHTVEVIPFSDQPGLRRISGNGQIGPHGAELPNPFIVQVNDSLGNPLPCVSVSFTIEEADTVCYGRGGTYNDPDIGAVTIPRICNNLTEGLLIGDAAATTNIHGQASIGLQLPLDEIGLIAVGVTANGESTHFYAASVPHLSNLITMHDVAYTPPANPALGPLNVTKIPDGIDEIEYLSDLSNYTLAITGLSASTGSTNGVASAPLEAGGSLTINGTGLSASGYTVWIGGTQATVISQSSTSITVEIPEGMPGAAAVVVDDGTSTPFKVGPGQNSGFVPSIASVPANFWRTAPKPIFIFADTGNLSGTEAKVKLLGLDICGNPLDLSTHSIELTAYEPDKTTSSSAVFVEAPDETSGIARVVHQSTRVESALVIGTVDGISSDWIAEGNTAVSTVPNLLAPPTFFRESTSYDNGINSVMTRGGDEYNTTDAFRQNPAFRLLEVEDDHYPIPGGSAGFFETEAHISVSDLTGNGTLLNTEISGHHALAGTTILAISGGPAGMLALTSSNVYYEVQNAPRPAVRFLYTLIPGWLIQDVARQEMELFFSGLSRAGDLGHRNIIIRLLADRTLP